MSSKRATRRSTSKQGSAKAVASPARDDADSGRATPKARANKAGQDKSQQNRAGKQRKKESGLGRLDDGLLFVLSHPLRVRMLAALNEEDGSASDLAERLNCRTWETAYHMRQLKKYGYVEFVKDIRVGSVMKAVYRAKRKVQFPTEVWEEMPPAVQALLVAAVFTTSFSDAELALTSRAYEERPESHASWSNLTLDEEGWLRIVKLLDKTLVEALEIESEFKERNAANDMHALTVSLNLSCFVLPDDAEAIIDRVDGNIQNRGKGRSALRHNAEDTEG